MEVAHFVTSRQWSCHLSPNTVTPQDLALSGHLLLWGNSRKNGDCEWIVQNIFTKYTNKATINEYFLNYDKDKFLLLCNMCQYLLLVSLSTWMKREADAARMLTVTGTRHRDVNTSQHVSSITVGSRCGLWSSMPLRGCCIKGPQNGDPTWPRWFLPSRPFLAPIPSGD